jgi:hypothetical protein
MATLNRRLSAIAAAHRMADHPFDTRCREITLVMDGLRRTKTVRQRQVAALTTPLLKRALGTVSESLAERRNRSLVLLGMVGHFGDLKSWRWKSRTSLSLPRVCRSSSDAPKVTSLEEVRSLQSH